MNLEKSRSGNEQTWRRARRSLPVYCCAAVALAALFTLPTDAQTPRRVNRLIETLIAGKPAITGESWVFVDQEHRPYDIPGLRVTLKSIFANKNAQGQPVLAPIVRVPTEGDQNVRWVIKQVLESGAMGIVIPQVENGEQALKIVQAMRYPQPKGAKYPTPVGRRGCGCGGGSDWGLQNPGDYVKYADPWPLNPEGELVSLPQIETPEGVKNINEILDVPGVTGVLVGPVDLAMNYGEGQWQNPKNPKPDSEAAVMTVAKACVAKKKTCGMVTFDEAQTKKYLEAGFRIIYGTYLKGSSN